jgi:hypothetical protein
MIETITITKKKGKYLKLFSSYILEKKIEKKGLYNLIRINIYNFKNRVIKTTNKIFLLLSFYKYTHTHTHTYVNLKFFILFNHFLNANKTILLLLF